MNSINKYRTLVAASVIIVVTSSLLFVFVNGQDAFASTNSDSSITGIAGNAGQNFYIYIGEVQGEIQGESSILSLDRENKIVGYQYTHNLYLPTDAVSGQATGRRVHTPLTILIQFDKSAPLLHWSFVNQENLLEVTMRFYRPDPEGSGQEEQYFTVKLDNAHIISIHDFQPNNQNPETYMPLVLELSFSYQQITWTWENGGYEATDTWGDYPTY